MKYSDTPQVTFCILAYNQAKFIESSIESAFAQTYQNIEFVISDDCSNDNTFELISDYVNNKKQERRVITNRNDKNVGTAKHLDYLVRRFSSGELIIVQAGDDFSTINRVEVLVEKWLESKKGLSCISSNYFELEYDGSSFKERQISVSQRENSVSDFIKYYGGDIGATYAFTPDVIKSFPVLDTNNFEDKCIAFRSKLLGGYKRINIPLVFHRKSGISDFVDENQEIKTVLNVRPAILRQMQNDIKESIISNKYSYYDLVNFNKILLRHEKFYILMRKFIDANGKAKYLYLLKLVFNRDFIRLRHWRIRIVNELLN